MKGCPVVRDDPIEAEYAKPLPWIGLYIAFFSLLCAGAMAIDAYRAFRRLKFWFPCRFFSLNAATLAFLTIATKLPVDLNTSMPQPTDQLTKLAGTVFLCIATGNFIPSLGDMDSSTIFSNVLALAILIFVVIANIIIQIITGVIYVFVPEHCVIIALLILHLFVFISAAIAIPAAKGNLENVFDRKIEDDMFKDTESISQDRLRRCANELWLMAHSASPQYVIGRSVVSAASGFFCLAAGGILIEALLRGLIWKKSLELCEGKSDYAWSIVVVLIVQSVAIIIGCIAPVSRWIGAVSLRGWSWKEMFKLEDHWIQLLVSWKESPLKVEHHNGITTILPHQIKLFALSLSIFLQKAAVVLSKTSRLLLVCPLSFIVDHLSSTSEDPSPDQITVLLLEGEEHLVDLIIRSGQRETERWIQKGRHEKPSTLEKLIQDDSTRLRGFTEVRSFLHSPPHGNCWALPLVTLAAIAAALFSHNDERIESLLRAVGEGLRYVRLVDTHLDNRGLVNSIKAADMIWMDVRLYNKWLEEDLRKKVGENRATEVLKKLEEKATDVLKGFPGESCPEWPEKALAADCMKTACARIKQDNGVSFERMSTVVADILGACLLNLPKALFHGCICCKVEVREKTVMDAVRILGEAEGLLNLIENSPVDRVSPNNRPYIDNWTNGRSSAEPESGCVASSLQGTANFSQADAVSDEV